VGWEPHIDVKPDRCCKSCFLRSTQNELCEHDLKHKVVNYIWHILSSVVQSESKCQR